MWDWGRSFSSLNWLHLGYSRIWPKTSQSYGWHPKVLCKWKASLLTQGCVFVQLPWFLPFHSSSLCSQRSLWEPLGKGVAEGTQKKCLLRCMVSSAQCQLLKLCWRNRSSDGLAVVMGPCFIYILSFIMEPKAEYPTFPGGLSSIHTLIKLRLAYLQQGC